MTDAVTVSADDIRAVAAVFTLAVACCGPAAASVPGFEAATQACERMTAAISQAQMPEDPVSGTGVLAITLHEAMTGFEAAGFDHHEAFEFVKMQAAIVLNLGAMRSLHG
jgi:hypothetical protein